MAIRSSTAFSKKILQLRYVLGDTAAGTIDFMALDLLRELRPNNGYRR